MRLWEIRRWLSGAKVSSSPVLNSSYGRTVRITALGVIKVSPADGVMLKRDGHGLTTSEA